MDWKTYKHQASRTFTSDSLSSISSIELRDKLNQMHCVVGISTEIAELMDALIKKDAPNIKEEIGDIFWYTANLCRLLDIKDDDLPWEKDNIKIFADEWLVGTQELLDHYKKAVYYGSDVDVKYVTNHIDMIKETLCGMVNGANGKVKEILMLNISKLSLRYPEKFTKESAENRDLDAEREILEGNEKE